MEKKNQKKRPSYTLSEEALRRLGTKGNDHITQCVLDGLRADLSLSEGPFAQRYWRGDYVKPKGPKKT